MRTSNNASGTFSDKNLQLALLDEVQENYDWLEGMCEAYEEARLTQPDWQSWEIFENDDPEFKPSLESFLLNQPLLKDKLLKIEALTLDNDRSIYQWIYPYWWEFGDHFVISNLDGIENCPSINYLNLGIVSGCSLEPLKALTQLSELWINALNKHTDIEILLDLPSLKRLEVGNWETSNDRKIWERIIDAVK